MIVLSNLTAQTIPVGGAVTFDSVKLKTGCGECFNKLLPTSVKLRTNGVYEVEFHANISGTAAGPVQLAIAIEGTALPNGLMDATVVTAGDLYNVGAGTYLKDCCCDLSRVSIINSGTNPVVLQPGSSFMIGRKA